MPQVFEGAAYPQIIAGFADRHKTPGNQHLGRIAVPDHLAIVERSREELDDAVLDLGIPRIEYYALQLTYQLAGFGFYLTASQTGVDHSLWAIA